jgi:Ni/Fe-hydrogenase 1 B-type cytochrome subunit
MTSTYRYSRSLRLWHWLSFATILLIIITVIVAKFFLNNYTNHILIKNQLAAQGISITEGQAFGTATLLSDKIWSVHVYLGYFLSALLLYRFLIEFFQPKERKLRNRIVYAFRWLYRGKPKSTALSNLFRQFVYILMYALFISSCSTGIWLANTQTKDFGLKHSVMEFHQQCFFLFLLLILLHLAGVIRRERREHGSLVSSMIHGG